MTTTMRRTSKTALALLLAALCALAVAGCGEKDKTYPEDAIATDTPQLVGQREYVSANETQLTMTITDAMRAASKADIAIIDAASFPESAEEGVIPAGSVTPAQLAAVMPGDRTIVTVLLKGEQILSLAEQNATFIVDKKKDDSYVHFSGVAFVYNKKKAAGSRIVDSSLDREEKTALDIDATYTVAMNSATKERLYKTAAVEADFGSDVAAVTAYLEEKGVSPLGRRMVDKAELDSPKVVVTVIIVVGVLAVAVLVIVYFVMKKKQKAARIKRRGEPRIDV